MLFLTQSWRIRHSYFFNSFISRGKTNQAVMAPSELAAKSQTSPLRLPPVHVSWRISIIPDISIGSTIATMMLRMLFLCSHWMTEPRNAYMPKCTTLSKPMTLSRPVDGGVKKHKYQITTTVTMLIGYVLRIFITNYKCANCSLLNCIHERTFLTVEDDDAEEEYYNRK